MSRVLLSFFKNHFKLIPVDLIETKVRKEMILISDPTWRVLTASVEVGQLKGM